MSAASRRRVVSAITTDTEARQMGEFWETRCIHCRSRVSASRSGELLGSATLEHLVPRSWFGKTAARDLTQRFSGADDPRNLAVACARCNHAKGVVHDERGPSSVRAREVIERLLAVRASRWCVPRGADG